MNLNKPVDYCACGFPQSHPIPHEHDRTEREKAITAHYEKERDALKARAELLASENAELRMQVKKAEAKLAETQKELASMHRIYSELVTASQLDAERCDKAEAKLAEAGKSMHYWKGEYEEANALIQSDAPLCKTIEEMRALREKLAAIEKDLREVVGIARGLLNDHCIHTTQLEHILELLGTCGSAKTRDEKDG